MLTKQWSELVSEEAKKNDRFVTFALRKVLSA